MMLANNKKSSSSSSLLIVVPPPPHLPLPSASLPPLSPFTFPCCSTTTSTTTTIPTIANLPVPPPSTSVHRLLSSSSNLNHHHHPQNSGADQKNEQQTIEDNNNRCFSFFQSSMDEKFTAPSLPVSEDEQQKEMIGGGLPFSSSRSACTLASPTSSPLSLSFFSGHWFSIALSLLVLLCAPNWQLVTALPRPAVDSAADQQQQLPLQRHVPVGSLFIMENSGQLLVDKSKLPDWIKVTADQKLVGIPQLRDVGTHRLALNNGQTHELNVGEDQDGVCGMDTATIWLEVIDPRQLGKLGVKEQFHAAQTILSKLREGTGVEIQAQDLRLFPHFYLNRYRTVTETMHESADAAAGGGSTVSIDQLVFMLNISCGELSEQGSEIISAAADAGLNVRVVQGSLRKSRLLPTTTQPAMTTTTAVTTTTTISATKAHADSALSPHLITIIVVIVLLILVVAVAMCWIKNKQSRKRQKQTDTVVGTATNGKGTSSASGPAAASISMTTPMLPSNGADGE